ncbi:hypothetical protein BC939DRAFT_442612 [Gamsiella multidivaricata]|uniref:uncharacterized protein n=1 Tax=Gamsiella multidivaricata TaxID=101098 RepID=UPI00221F2CBB|nr:uncharacterized protein BC939DRAFT_442612 [Gamsiella multidivaricata]KAG0366558.1 hypothetical protein BGZ54_005193 [Gamsiella multidivaricata]KAI7828688.1 hypothetical protein BC939DRAFT_442612 [Gamsiella multidivaricata]
MIFSTTTYTAILVSALAVFSSYTPQAEAHSWMDCVDWKFNNPSKPDWSDKGGKCVGYARRYPIGKPFASLDSADPSRHYQQAGNPNTALPCSDHKHGKDVGSDETLARIPSAAYGGKWGRMTMTSVGDTLCVRWPAKNHAEHNEDNTVVQINLSKNKNGADPTQQQLLQNTIARLPYKNCGSASTPDKRPCGGCFKVPVRASGIYLLQWRWMLNPGEWYTSCADIQIGGDSGVAVGVHNVAARRH